MARQFGLALAPWDAIGSGRLLSKKQLEARLKSGEKMRGQGGNEQTEIERKYSEVLEEIANKHGVESVTAVALACAYSSALRMIECILTPSFFPQTSWPRSDETSFKVMTFALEMSLTDPLRSADPSRRPARGRPQGRGKNAGLPVKRLQY